MPTRRAYVFPYSKQGGALRDTPGTSPDSRPQFGVGTEHGRVEVAPTDVSFCVSDATVEKPALWTTFDRLARESE